MHFALWRAQWRPKFRLWSGFTERFPVFLNEGKGTYRFDFIMAAYYEERVQGRNHQKLAATCRMRLEGWVRMVAARSPIWGRVDIAAFCRITGYSREHTTRTLSAIRRECRDLAFETKICRQKGDLPKRWGVIVAERTKLKFDRCSLFFSEEGRLLHNYNCLGNERQKLRHRGGSGSNATEEELSISISGRSKGLSYKERRLEFFPSSSEIPNRRRSSPCDLPPYGKDSFGIQRDEAYGGGRPIGPIGIEGRTSRFDSLRRKAFSLSDDLSALHWDNCKVIFSSRGAFRYAMEALQTGQTTQRIVRCYERALFICHGLACDVGARQGEIVYFNISSTLSRARAMLESDGLTARQRIAQWYRGQPPKPIPPKEPSATITIGREEGEESTKAVIPGDVLELRRMIAESLGCEIPDADQAEAPEEMLVNFISSE